MDISPEKQNIDKLFGSTTYHIDFYQRDYKWTSEPVRRLLDDIFYAFEASYEKNLSLDANSETVSSKYPWYYLNSYVTNSINGKIYVVDGQQRLTTITLILIELLHRSKLIGSGLSGWIDKKIAGQNGFKNQFWMNHERSIQTLEALFAGKDFVSNNSSVTTQNMLGNYSVIHDYLENKFSTKHKFETFVFYFLNRLVLINLNVEQTDVPMVFEVINDRGVKLRPYEILKGKLLGQIDKDELEKNNYYGKWEEYVGRVNLHKLDEIDVFFVYYLKSKYANSRSVAQRFDSDYHREMFKQDMNDMLDLQHNPTAVKSFIKTELNYYTALYSKIWHLATIEKNGYEAIYYNKLNEMDSQFLLILSSCLPNDPEEDAKLKLVSTYIDRFYTLLRLQRAYDSRQFSDDIFEISLNIRNKQLSEIKEIFDKKLKEILAEKRGVADVQLFEYAQFRNTSVNDLSTRFIRYFFARVDKYIAENSNMNVKHPFTDLVTKTGSTNGFHIEHILSNNIENLELYQNNRETFEIDRNRLGAVLLLKGKDNISSGNEVYDKKLKTYASSLHWNETLTEDLYKSKKDFINFINEADLQFEFYNIFSQVQVENRQKLLFEIVCQIWEV